MKRVYEVKVDAKVNGGWERRWGERTVLGVTMQEAVAKAEKLVAEADYGEDKVTEVRASEAVFITDVE